MNAASRHPLRCQFIACAAAIGCSIAGAQLEFPAIAKMTSAQLRAAYLECDRLSAQAILAPDEMAVCVGVGDVLLQRDFGGRLELQLQWWRGTQAEHAAAAATAAQAGIMGAGPAAAASCEWR